MAKPDELEVLLKTGGDDGPRIAVAKKIEGLVAEKFAEAYRSNDLVVPKSITVSTKGKRRALLMSSIQRLSQRLSQETCPSDDIDSRVADRVVFKQQSSTETGQESIPGLAAEEGGSAFIAAETSTWFDRAASCRAECKCGQQEGRPEATEPYEGNRFNGYQWENQ